MVENSEFLLKNKFWKFASEILGASMCIFDKRIDNCWFNINKVHTKLLKVIAEGYEPEEDDDSDS